MANKNQQDLGLFQQRLIFQITSESVNYYETMTKGFSRGSFIFRHNHLSIVMSFQIMHGEVGKTIKLLICISNLNVHIIGYSSFQSRNAHSNYMNTMPVSLKW